MKIRAARAKLIDQALDMSDSLPRNASEEARAELSAIWKEVKGLKGAIEWLQGVEEQQAVDKRRRAPRRGRSR